MTNENTIYNNEETVFESATDENTIVSEAPENPATQEKKSTPAWQTITIGGVSGIILGAGGTLLTSAITAEEAEIPTEDPKPVEPEDPYPPYLDGELEFSNAVDDSMSFSEAFAAARADVGPGGVFEWHGGIYGTYYATEWNSMSDAEKAEYGSHINWEGKTMDEYDVVTDESNDHSLAHHTVNAENSEEVIEDNHSEKEDIQVLGIEHVTNDDGEDMVVADVLIEDEEVVLVDVDVDGNFDAAIIDTNHDGSISDNEIYDIQDAGMTVEDLQAYQEIHYEHDNIEYASNDDMPDFVNDADSLSYV